MGKIAILLYPDFTALDFIGPLEVLGRLPDGEVHYTSLSGGPVSNTAGLTVMTEPLSEMEELHILLIPGGFGSRNAVKEPALLDEIRRAAGRADYVLTVCTGSALAAAAGLLDGRKATSNKIAFAWASSMGPKVLWDRDARWTKDGKYYTSGGVAAGIDMALGFAADRLGREKALSIAEAMEYRWNDNSEEGWCFRKK
ncbi:DJ-1/PfpI family protein [Dialister sp.]|jgi:transcriptional regulator GlxA family with amidase domain|uniref:DJ-1/PfpI family protein n=1 Tax=Dialister sp. TaxID=1955814 RepID=UPI003A5C373E